ncbi:MAG: hypothetical protein ACRD21_19080 [Vicinamibacteria bacterium]
MTVVRECRVRLDATCVRLPVDRYEWILDVDDEWKTEYIRDGSASFTHHFSDCDDDSEVITFQLTVHRGGSSDTATKSIRVPGDDLKVAPANPAMQFQSHLALPPLDGSSRARVLLNGSLARVVESSHPVEVRADAGSGSNRIEAFVVRATGASGHFRFDFSTERLRRGSLRVEHGSLLAMESNAIVFRLSGQAGEHVSFTFELDR